MTETLLHDEDDELESHTVAMKATSLGDTLVLGAAQRLPKLGAPLGPGTTLNGRYTVRRPIGHGGMGWVYDVLDALHPDRAVALKFVAGAAGRANADDPRAALFAAEFRTMTRLSHPNVAQVYDFEQLQDSDDFVLTMERVDGGTLDVSLEGRGADDWYAVIDPVVQICRALSYMHSRRINHFDLKPSNVLVDRAGGVKVVDFGISGATPQTHAGGVVLGTPQYMAPERLLGHDTVDHRADLYSLGVMLYELVVGVLPCASADPVELTRWFADGGVRVPESARLPPWLARLITQLCARDPFDRFRNAGVVLHEINTAGGFGFPPETADTRQSYVTSPRFSGRARAFEQTFGFLSRRLRGAGGEPVLFVRGLSGVGKSRLLREARYATQAQSMVFLEANCYESSLVEYGPIAELLHQLVPLVETLGGGDSVRAALPELVKLAPRLAAGRVVDEVPRAATVDGERARLLETTAEFLVQAAGRIPFVVHVNDLHWAASGPAQLFTYLARRIHDDQARGEVLKLALIASYRSDEVTGRPLAEVVETLHRHRLCCDLELLALSDAEVGELVRSMLGVEAIPEEFLSRVTRETAGNPFYVQEVMRGLFENGSVFLEDGRWAARDDVGELAIPATIAEVFRRRFTRLEPGAQDVVRLLAVHGQPLDLSLVAELAGGVALAISTLSELELKGIVVRHTVGGGAGRFNLAHDRLRETVYSEIPPDERRDWHLRLAERLEAQKHADRQLDELARHFWEARVPAKALEYALAAGHRAAEGFSNEAAAEHLARALTLLSADDPRRPSALELRADVLVRLSSFDAALAIYRELAELLSDPVDLSRITGHISNVYFQQNDLEGAEAAAWKSVEFLGEKRPEGFVGWTRATLAGFGAFALEHKGLPSRTELNAHSQALTYGYDHLSRIYFFLDPLRAFCVALRSLKMANSTQAPRLADQSKARSTLGVILACAGMKSLANSLVDRAVEEAERASSEHILGRGLYYQEVVRRFDAGWDRKQSVLERSGQALRKAGDLFDLGSSLYHLADIHFMMGDVGAALRVVVQYNTEASRLGEFPMIAKATMSLEAQCRSLQLRWAEADELFAKSVSLAARARDTLFQCTALAWWAQSLLLRGDPASAREKIDAAATLRREKILMQNYAANVLWLEPRIYLQAPATSAAFRRARVAHARAMVETLHHCNWRPAALVNDALILERRGKCDRADARFTEALALARRQGAVYLVGDTLLEWSRVLERRGELGRAAEQLREARALAVSGGNLWLQGECDALLARGATTAS